MISRLKESPLQPVNFLESFIAMRLAPVRAMVYNYSEVVKMDPQGGSMTKFCFEAAHELDIEEAVSFMKNKFPLRTQNESISRAIDMAPLRPGETKADAEKRMKSVVASRPLFSMWKSGKRSMSRDHAIKMCLALNLNAAQTEGVLFWFMHEGFYLRNYKDLIYAYFLDRKLGWSEVGGKLEFTGWDWAQKLVASFSRLDAQNLKPPKDPVLGDNLTVFFQSKYEQISSEASKEAGSATDYERAVDPLKALLSDHGELLGTYRRRAYEIFDDLWKELELYTDSSSCVNELTETYKDNDLDVLQQMRMGLKREDIGKSDILGIIASGIPNAQTINAILRQAPINGTVPEVTRKYIISVYMVSCFYLLEEPTPDTREASFEEAISNLNINCLAPCGFGQLDPRNPYDWAMMNALYAFAMADETAFERLKNLFDLLAGRQTEQIIQEDE
jgi:hypothetical protein